MGRNLIDTGLTEEDVMEELARTSVRPTTCTYEGCEKPYFAKGYCNHHYRRRQKTGDVDLPAKRVCWVKGCDKPHNTHDLCRVHYNKVRRWLKTQAVA